MSNREGSYCNKSQAIPTRTCKYVRKQCQEIQKRNIGVQIDGKIPLDSGRYAGEPWEQEFQDRGLSI